MYSSWLFWIALALPGFALARRVSRDDLGCGVLGALGVSYVYSLALLSPFSILCYMLHAPMAVFSAVVAIAMAYAGFEIARRGWWRELRGPLAGAVGVELVIIAVDLVMSARVGAFIHGDARVHLARIRFMLDHGFNNNDPFVSTPYFFPIYHTNLIHALYAACAQITRVDYLSAWFASVVWGKLLAVAGVYYMVWTLFERRWAAWAAVAFTVAVVGPTNFIIYPNKLAPLWLMPMMIAFAVQAFQAQVGWIPSLKLGMGALILGQVHGLYAGFAALLLGPVIAAGALVRMIRRHPDRWRTATGAVALGLGLPFIYITQSGMRTGSGDAKPDSTSAIASSNNDSFVRLESGKVMLDPRKRMGREWGWRYVLLAAAAAFGLTKAHRRRAGVLVAVLIVAGVVFYVPPVCTLVAERVGSLWALGRMGFVFGLGFIGLVIGAGSVMLEPLLRRRWQRAIVTIVVVLMAIPYSDLTAKDSWPTYMTRCGKSTPWRRDRLDRFRATRAFCDEHIPAGSSVLIDEGNGVTLAMACDCHIIASYSASNGVVDLAERRDDLGRLLQPASKTDWPARRRLLEKYNITHVLAYGWPIEWARGRVSRYWCGGDGVFLELADDLDSARIDAARGPDSDFRLGAGNLAAKRRVADILLDLGETSAGVEAFEGMAKRYGKSAKTQLQYGDVLVKAGDLSGAVEVFRRAVELQPRSGVIHYRLASALSELGRVEEAYDEYERAARLAPEHVRAQRDLGFAALQLRRPGDAASAFRRAIELKPRSADAHFGLAEALTALGRVDRAVKEYREALRLKPNHTRARAGLTTALREMGDSGT